MVLLGVEWVTLDGLRRPLARQLSAAIGRRVRVRGDVRIDFGLRPHLDAERVTIDNPSGWEPTAMAEVGRLELELDPWKLLRGVIDVAALRLVDVEATLAVDAAGRKNWRQPGAPAGDIESVGAVQVHVHTARFENARVAYADARTGRRWHARLGRADVVGLGGGASIGIEAEGELADESFAFTAHVEAPVEARAGRPYVVSLQGVAHGTDVAIAGTVESPWELSGLELGVVAARTDVGELLADFGLGGTQPGLLTASARLRGTEGHLRADDIEVKVGIADGSWMNLSGSVDDVWAVRGVAMTLRFGGDDLRQVLGGRTPWLGPLGPFQGAGSVEDSGAGIDLRALTVAIGAPANLGIDVTGDVADLLGAPQVDVGVRVAARDLAAVGAAVGWPSLPAMGPVVATATVDNRDGRIGTANLDVAVGAAASARVGPSATRDGRARTPRPGPSLRVAGRVADLRALDGVDLRVDLGAPDLASLGRLLDVPLPAVGPVEVAGRVEGAGGGFAARGFTLRLNQTLFRGNVAATMTGRPRPHLAVTLDTGLLRLGDIGIAPHVLAARAVVPAKAKRRPESRFRWNTLRAVDGVLRVRARRATGLDGDALDGVTLAAEISRGVLTVKELAVSYPSGKLVAQARIDARTQPATLHLTGSGTGVALDAVTAQLAGHELVSGNLTLDVDLHSSGQSPSELLSALDGDVKVVVQGGSTAAPFSRALAADMTRALTAEEPENEPRRIHCVVGEFAIENGIARGRKLLVDVDDLTIIGQGLVDLGRRTLDLTLLPRRRDAGLFTALTEVEVSGSLAQPTYAAAKHSTFATAILQFVGSATSSLRALLPMDAAREPCAEALAPVVDPDAS